MPQAIKTLAEPHVLILGTGIAGLSTALKFATVAKVTVVCKAERAEGATRYAQGGIASVWSKQDSFAEHVADTLRAGDGLCHEDIARICVEEGPARVQELIDLGVKFTRTENDPVGIDPADTFDLHREGGHGKRRILHADDLTGWAIEKALLDQIDKNPKIQVLEHHVAIDLITEGKVLQRWRKAGRCLGAYVLDERASQIRTISADVTVLATGGAGKIYLYTSNPDTATGDGIAMAYRAGARVANLEFMQFHPTCLYHPAARNFLISEALRGEGAVLRTLAGEEFMKRHHPMGSLAPRDIVARAIDAELKRTGDKYVLLDCTHLSREDIERKFPNIDQICRKYGIDMAAEGIPVVPAAHYTCGGVLVDQSGLSSIPGLYAVGEVSCTGLHGANRLASNSLLEAVVFAERIFLHAREVLKNRHDAPVQHSPVMPPALPEWDAGRAVPIEEQIDIAANWLEIRNLMWNYVGIVRSNSRLERARRRIELLKTEIYHSYWGYLLTKDLIELRNLLIVADLTVQCAQRRHESRGLHYTVDYPEHDNAHFSQDTVI